MKKTLPLLLIVGGVGSCTGGQNALPTGAGGIRIAPGEDLSVDLTDVIQLGVTGFNVSLKSISDDYQTFKEFYDVTPLAQQALAESKSSFSFVIPKNVAPPRPFVIVVDIPELQEYLVDAVYADQALTRPGLASRLAFDLLDSFYTPQTPKSLAQYSSQNFSRIRGLIQDRIDSLHSQSEHLSHSSLPFPKLMRFYRNSLAFNPAYLDEFKKEGVKFAFEKAAISGVNQDRMPSDQTLSSCFRGFCFEYARNFRVIDISGAEQPALKPPFKHDSNSPAQMLGAAARPAPSSELVVNERVMTNIGDPPALSVSTQGFDLDEDYMEKSMRVIYTPRKLPDFWKNTTNKPLYSQSVEDAWSARHPATDQYLLGLNQYDQPDSYALQSIDYDEALNPEEYLDSDGNNVCGDCRTATREIYYFITDGMAWVPYKWKYRYMDNNRQPQFVLNDKGGINSTHYDDFLRIINGNEPELPRVPGWRLHASHCENDPEATPTPIPGNNQTINYYTRIKQKSDGPWSCAFSVFDPDIRDDPNGAPDEFYFSVKRENDPFTIIELGARLSPSDPAQFDTNGAPVLAWPPLAPLTMEQPLKLRAMSESIDPQICSNYGRCAFGLSQVTIDNAVKNAAESQANQTMEYTIQVFDRRTGGQSNQRNVSRAVQFLPNPPMLVNFSQSDPLPDRAQYSLSDMRRDASQNEVHWRTDTFASEIRAAAKLHPSIGSALENIGIHSDLLNPTIRQGVFRVADGVAGAAGAPPPNMYDMSEYFIQPRALCDSATNTGSLVGDDRSSESPAALRGSDCRGGLPSGTNPYNGLNLISFRPSVPVFLGTTLRKARTTGGGQFDLYFTPREQDLSCSINTDSTGTWDQRPPGSGYLGLYTNTQRFYSHPISLFNPTPTPAARTPGNLGGFTFEINAIDYDNIDLRSGEPSDPVFFTLQTDQAVSGQFLYCHPPSPNLDSRLGETYLPTNSGSTNGVDPDACQTWSEQPPARMQPIPVFYTGTTSSGAAVPRKLVYHRLRVFWVPRDQGREKKLESPDPKGLIRNLITSINLNGNVYAQKMDTRDRTEPYDITTKDKTTFPLYALKRELPACLSASSMIGETSYLFGNTTESQRKTFTVLDGNHAGSVTGTYEAELRLLGESPPRTIEDPEVLKFIPYTVDCTGIQRRSLALSNVNFSWRRVKDASSYLVQYNRFPPPAPNRNNNWVSVTTVSDNGSPEYSVNVPSLESYRSYYFRALPTVNGSAQTNANEVLIQANPSPTPSGGSAPPNMDDRLPAIWYSASSSGSDPRIRMKSLFNQGAGFCIQHRLLPIKDMQDVPFTGVWRIQRRSPSANPLNNNPIRFKSDWLFTCTSRPFIDLDPYANQVYVAVKNLTHTPSGTACMPAPMGPGNPIIFQGRSIPNITASGEDADTINLSVGANDADSVEITLIYQINPDLPQMGALTSPTPAPPVSLANYQMDWFPGVYQGNNVPTLLKNGWLVQDKNAPNSLFFGIIPYNTFIFDKDPTSPTFGRSTHLGLTKGVNGCTEGCLRPHPMADNRPMIESARPTGGPSPDAATGVGAIAAGTSWPSNSATAGGLTRVTPSPTPPFEHDYAVQIIDFDEKPLGLYLSDYENNVRCLSATAQSCFRKNGSKLQVIAWPPAPAGAPLSINYTFRSSDRPEPKTTAEADPYDVMSFVLGTPSPHPTTLPVNTPTLAGVGGRTDCTSKPPNYPQTSTLRMDSLAGYKQCQLNWTLTNADEGKTFKYWINTQDNHGADPSSTPITMGIGGQHPRSSNAVNIPFFWDAQRQDVNGNWIIPVPNSAVTVQYTIDPPDRQVITGSGWNGEWETFDATLPNCLTSSVCHRARTWVTVPAASCTPASRYCLITVSATNLYRRHWFRTQQNSQTNGMGASYVYTNNGLRETDPYYMLQPIPPVGSSTALTNGPIETFDLDLISLELNKAPFFTANSSSATPIGTTYRYTAASGNKWEEVFTPAMGTPGVAPTSCSPDNTSRFSCASGRARPSSTAEHYLFLKDGESTATPYNLDEQPSGGPKYEFKVFAKDIANLNPLKTLTAVQPTEVYIVDGPNRGSTYSPPSFTGNRIEWSASPTPGAIEVSFKWAPSDEEAHALSNPGGFLIPIRISDSSYDPSGGTSNFNPQFLVPSLSSTVWIWCKLNVRNYPPLITFLQNGAWQPLQGATLQFQTGNSNAGITVRVSDPDLARFRFNVPSGSVTGKTERTETFLSAPYLSSPHTNLGLSATGLTAAHTPPPGTAVVQQFTLNSSPTLAGLYENITLQVVDPGDPSLGLTAPVPTPTPDPNYSGNIRAQTNPQTITFSIAVVGKPEFLAPSPTPGSSGSPTLADAYTQSTFNYPLSLKLTRPYERSETRNFFMGIQSNPVPAVPPSHQPVPLALSTTQTGFYINENYMLRVKNSATHPNSNLAGQTRQIHIGAIVDNGSMCQGNRNVATSTITNNGGVTLMRIRESASGTGVVEYCHVSPTNRANHMAQTTLRHVLHADKPTMPTISSARVIREVGFPAAPSIEVIRQEFRDFKARCKHCNTLDTNTGFSLMGGGQEIDTVAGSTASLVYIDSAINRSSTFSVDMVSPKISKSYLVMPASMGGEMALAVLKDEALKFTVELNSLPVNAPKLYARWYVNGCLRATKRIETTTVELDMGTDLGRVPLDAGGRNDDCSGQFRRPDTNTDNLGMLAVSLRIANGSELVSDVTTASPFPSDSSTLFYTFNMSVVNLNATPQLASGPLSNPRAAPITNLYGTSTNTAEMRFLFPFSAENKNMYVFTEKSGTSTVIRLRELLKNGNPGSTVINVNCINYTANPNWIGLHADSSLLRVAMSNSSGGALEPLGPAYPTSNRNITYGSGSAVCYQTWTGTSSNPLLRNGNYSNIVSPQNATVAAQVLAYSANGSATRPMTSLKNTDGLGGHLIDGTNASSEFWDATFPMVGSGTFDSRIYTTAFAPLAQFSNNMVHRNIIADGKLFHAIGQDPNKPIAASRGHVVISTYATAGRRLDATPIQIIGFGPTETCNFPDAEKVVPMDLVYYKPNDSIVILGTDTNSTPKGRLVVIRNALTSPVCQEVSNSMIPPAKQSADFNTAIQKVVVDDSGIVFGVISKSKVEAGQLFSFDVVSRKPPIVKSLSFPPHSILYLKGNNALYVPSYIPNFTSPPIAPTLYRVW